jgi:hypothetical protein
MHRRHVRLIVGLLIVFACVFAGAPLLAQNGIADAPTSGPAASGPIVIDDPLWYEFGFTTAGIPATGCAPADPIGPGCFPSGGGNFQFADAPPWTFNAAGPVVLTVVDAFLFGDVFEVFDGGASIGSTSTPGAGLCGADPEDCLADPGASSGTFELGAGAHSITIIPTSSPFGGGAAYFRVEGAGVPVPDMPPAAVPVLVGLLLAIGAWQLHRRRAVRAATDPRRSATTIGEKGS